MSTGRSLVTQLTDKLIGHALTGSRPTSPTDGVDLAAWKTGGAYGPVSVVIYFDGTAPAAIAAPAAGSTGVELWGFSLGLWWLIAVFNAGVAIPIASDSLGSVEQLDDVGGFERLFVAGTVSSGSASVQFAPLEVLR